MGDAASLGTGIETIWRHGKCYAMASALARTLDWPVVTLTVDVPTFERMTRAQVAHAWVRGPDGRGLDAGGFFNEAELVAQFLTNPSKWSNDRVTVFEDDAAFVGFLRACYDFDERWAEYLCTVHEPGVREAIPLVEEILVPLLEAEAPCPGLA